MENKQVSFYTEKHRKENSSIRILVVDDNESMQMLTKTILNKCNYNTDIASNGEEMIRKWETNEYDMLLVDLQMPIMDGVEATRIIREKEKNLEKKTIIIVVTGSEILEGHQAIALGFDTCLSKPYARERLLEIVKQFTG